MCFIFVLVYYIFTISMLLMRRRGILAVDSNSYRLKHINDVIVKDKHPFQRSGMIIFVSINICGREI
jgi:hypothetical protein